MQDSYLSAPWVGTSIPREADVIVNILDGSGVIIDDRGQCIAARPGKYYLLSAVRNMGFHADTSRLSLLYCNRAGGAEDSRVRQCEPVFPVGRIGVLTAELRARKSRGVNDAEVNSIVRELDQIVSRAYPVENPGITCDPRFQNLLLRMHSGYFDANRTLGLLRALAAYSGMSERTIQAKFRRVVGNSPAEYMRNIMLDRAERLLSDASYAESIGDTARNLGFSNAGRFAEQYFARHSETPSGTLKRARLSR
ncbi:helix-turn-helix transcriptional regulator [Curtobacterium flaccumfaciens pv. flaccumfaciens]|uniref:Helix-turn-helix transcriptional regulator n=1 Tax=Curtobacterium aurantiacum TaxID=3236919 RepID=A0ABS5VJF9_9MICO|nr:helix-turn-helix transcriptional regulator [Curtobacterium flaccumfaciens pv. flaccumfaciens]MBT1589567.1 helix-turn-helix transcriptional regulator [Curtobacterium flaccumfaciens pv. flaccumfaciens]MBT1680443.1 helix-turn-helix transcriptional regulator [Curtobacterium flaccumfaciens pv. flaccumfaciens]